MYSLFLTLFLVSATALTDLPDIAPDEDVEMSGEASDSVLADGMQSAFTASGNDFVLVSPMQDITGLEESLLSIDEKLETVVNALNTSVDSYQVSEYYREYFKGVLQNMPYTNYLCYAQRVNTGSGYNSYITHYYLMYDLDIVGGNVVPNNYPCIDVYSVNNVYYANETYKYFEGYPTIGYASFAPYSALIDRSFDFQGLQVGLLCVAVFFLIARKTVFS